MAGSSRSPLLGFVVNPIAGIGGAVGLKGSDGPATLARALALGATSPAPDRAASALRAIAGRGIRVITADGPMGAAACIGLGLPHQVVGATAGSTEAADTGRAVAAMRTAGAELILFVGGDGTARDVAAEAGRTPVLGVPSGVKMYSGVFAASAALAGRLAAQFLTIPPGLRRVEEVEVLDADEQALLRDEPSLRLYGTAIVPAAAGIPRAKAWSPADQDGDMARLCADLAARFEPDCLHIVGPGRTMRSLVGACGLPKTLLGVDVLCNGRLVARDASEADILSLMRTRPARVWVGLIGAQGGLFGRGNQQIGARVLRGIARERIAVVASGAKVATLPRCLFVDTGDPDLDRSLAGYIRVETGPGRSTMLRVRAGDDG